MTEKCISFTNTSILFFNFISFFTGGYFILKNFEDLNKKNGIKDCYHIFLLCCFGVLNNLLPLIGCFQLTEFSILAFICSLALGSYNTYNLNIITNNCSSYFYNQYKEIWYYYSISVGIQLLNVLMYFLKFNFSLCQKKPIVKKDEETQTLINPSINSMGMNQLPAHIYDDTEDLYDATEDLYDNLQDSLIQNNVNLNIVD